MPWALRLSFSHSLNRVILPRLLHSFLSTHMLGLYLLPCKHSLHKYVYGTYTLAWLSSDVCGVNGGSVHRPITWQLASCWLPTSVRRSVLLSFCLEAVHERDVVFTSFAPLQQRWHHQPLLLLLLLLLCILQSGISSSSITVLCRFFFFSIQPVLWLPARHLTRRRRRRVRQRR